MLGGLLNMLARSNADELRIVPGGSPTLSIGGEIHNTPQAALTDRMIRNAVADLISEQELAELPNARARIIRHEHNGALFVVEVSRGTTGISLAIRPAKRPEQPKPRTSRKMKAVSRPPKEASAEPARDGHAPKFGAPPVAQVPPRDANTPREGQAVRDHGRPPADAQQRAHAEPHRAHAEPQRPHAEAQRPHAEQPRPPAEQHRPPADAQQRPPAAAPQAAPHDVRTERDRPRIDAGNQRPIDGLLRLMLKSRASDLHMSSGNHPVLRIDGEIHFMKDLPVQRSSDIEALVRPIMNEKAARAFTELRDCDFAYEIPETARFRVNVFEDRNGVGAVLRQIPIEIVSAEKLGLPRACLDLCNLTKGLVVVTGPTGSGKSTTLAAMVDHINKTRSDHIITIEDPVEFVHPNARCLVNQREVGQHTMSFKNALRAALREDPDIVLVGEMRDLETISIAIETAETGHLVFGTLHTTTAISTVDRIIDQFPTDRQAQIRVMLSESLKGVIAQTLCKRTGGGRIAAHEILLGTTAVASLIREAKTFQMASIMQTSKQQGMVTLNDSLFALVQRNLVDAREAWMKAVDKSGFVAMLKNANIPTPFLT